MIKDEGDVMRREVRRFAWLPSRLADGSWCHLDWMIVTEELEPDYGGVSTGIWLAVKRVRAAPARGGPTR